jgi:DsbE subfamily thiol:disulfide oxidoreductase
MAKQNMKLFTVFAVLVLAILAVINGFQNDTKKEERLETVNIPGLYNGQVHALPEKDGLLIINIFASGCPPCEQELPLLAEISGKWRVPVFGVAWKDETAGAVSLLEKHGNPFQWAGIDDTGEILSTWGVSGVPETLVVVDSRVVYSVRGPLNQRILQDMLGPIVLSYASD